MIYTNISNPRWNASQTAVDCEVTLESGNVISFSATPNDFYAHTVEIYNRCISGEFGPIAEYVKQPDEYPVEVLADEPQPQVNGAQTL